MKIFYYILSFDVSIVFFLNGCYSICEVGFMVVLELKEMYDKVKEIELKIKEYEKVKKDSEKEVENEKLKLLDLPSSSSESVFIYEKIHSLWKGFHDALEQIKNLKIEKEIYENQMDRLEDEIQEYLTHDVFQLGKALEKVLNSISTRKYVFQQDYLYDFVVEYGNHRHAEILKKKIFLLVREDFINHEPFIRHFDEEVLAQDKRFDDYGRIKYDNYTLGNYWEYSDLCHDPFGNMIQKGEIINVPFSRTVGAYNRNCFQIMGRDSYVNNKIDFRLYFHEGELNLERDSLEDIYNQIVYNYILSLTMFKYFRKRLELFDDEMKCFTEQYIEMLKVNPRGLLVWDSSYFDIYDKENIMTKGILK